MTTRGGARAEDRAGRWRALPSAIALAVLSVSHATAEPAASSPSPPAVAPLAAPSPPAMTSPPGAVAPPPATASPGWAAPPLAMTSPGAVASPPAVPSHWRVLFLRVDFPDVPAQRPWTDFQNPARTGFIDRLVSFYDEVSRGRFHIEPTVSERVYRLPRRKLFYVQKPGRLIADAMALADAPEPQGERSLLDRAQPDAVVVFFAGPGAESDIEKKMPRQIPWSNALTGGSLGSAAGRPIESGIVVAEDPFPPLSPFGVIAHEFGHILGLPELYAPNKTHEGIGTWGLMGQGSWVGLGNAPPHLTAWCKSVLGWVDTVVVDETRKVTLPSVQKGGRVVKIWAKGPEHPNEYFLIENRTRAGHDRNIPGAGLLIWHVDEALTSFRRSQDDAAHKRLDLLTADSWPSHLDLGHTRGGNRGDAGDPWSARPHGPGPHTRPSTAAYDGTPGRFSIENISPAGEVMTFDVVFAREDGRAPSLDTPGPPN